MLPCTVTHYLPEAGLCRLYADCAGLLAPGGLLANADHMPLDDHLPTVGAALTDRQQAARARGWATGVPDWEAWWADVERDLPSPTPPALGVTGQGDPVGRVALAGRLAPPGAAGRRVPRGRRHAPLVPRGARHRPPRRPAPDNGDPMTPTAGTGQAPRHPDIDDHSPPETPGDRGSTETPGEPGTPGSARAVRTPGSLRTSGEPGTPGEHRALGEPGAPSRVRVRVVVVGAGPHGLAAALHLVAADPGIRDEVVVVDPVGGWLRAWDERFARLEIEHLSSPGVHHTF